jgi:Ca2+-binding RTX toxin-like protein
VTAAAGVAVNVVGNDLDNYISGNAAANKLSGGVGNDSLVGGAGNDTMTGGEGDDNYVVTEAGDVVIEKAGEGHDTVFARVAALTLSVDVEDLVFDGSGAFSGTGNAGANRLFAGTSSGAKLDGGDGNDLLVGGAGNDSLIGGLGDDLFQASGGKDSIDGGAGYDALYGLGSFAGYTVTRPNATDTVLADGQGHVYTVRNVEYFYFDEGGMSLAQLQNNTASAGKDWLTGTAGSDLLDGGAGADTLVGGAGDDTYVVDNVGDAVVENGGEGRDQVMVALASGTYVLADNVEDARITGTAALGVTGNALDNALAGNAVANRLSGGAGNDTLDGGAGSDTLIGGSGDDLYVVTEAGDVVTELAGEGHDTVRTSLAAYTLGANLEDLFYIGAGAFAATGNALANHISGGNGGAKLDGGAGNDTLAGGSGNDSLQGGAGDDLLLASAGKDTIDGGAGNDSLDLLGRLSDYTISRPTAGDLVLADHAGNVITVRNVEQLLFLDGAVATADLRVNVATSGNDDLHGTDGGDLLNGLAGNDTMAGGDGDDVYVVDAAGDVVVEHAGGGVDLVNVAFAAAGTYVLGSEIENASVTSAASVAVNLSGNELDNVLTGNGAANTLIGGLGNDTLNGGAGNDSLAGGAGDDLYIVDAAGDKVVETAGNGNDRVETTLASYTLAANVEDLRYTGAGTAAFTGTGNELANTLRGGAGSDVLNGAAGDDVLIGGAGSDKLTGGTGIDAFVLDSLNGSDTITDFASGADQLLLSRAGLGAVGNGDLVLDRAIVRAVPGGFYADTELTVFTQHMATASTANAAAIIGSGLAAYTVGQTALFAVSTDTATSLYLFKSSGEDALVSAGELTQLVVLTGTPAMTAADFQLVA